MTQRPFSSGSSGIVRGFARVADLEREEGWDVDDSEEEFQRGIDAPRELCGA